ncbi:MAG: hypothetical protein HQM09_01765 [Candidatus Riflebacteria bacterium]|nr:hypothetical protein [Candidatus Riflebacteria bacterium]
MITAALPVFLTFLHGCNKWSDSGDPLDDSHSCASAASIRDWTLLVYQANDNSLAGPLSSDFREMENAAFPDDAIAVLIQTSVNQIGAGRWRVGNSTMTQLISLPAGNSADPSRLSDFIAWGLHAFPARRYALIIASHGSGWRNGSELIARSSRRPGVISDEPDKALMNIPDLGRAISGGLSSAASSIVPGSVKTPLLFDLIGFDACFMGMIEVIWELRGLADCLVVSETSEPFSGYAYDKTLAILASDSRNIDARSLGHAICETYADSFRIDPLDMFAGLISVIDLKKLDLLISAFGNWAESISNTGSTGIMTLAGLRDERTGPSSDLWPGESYALQAMDLIDYRDLVELASAAAAELPTTRLAAETLQKTIASMILFQKGFGNYYKRARGVSIALPGESVQFEYSDGSRTATYSDLAIAKQTAWGDILSKVANSGAKLPEVSAHAISFKLSWNGDGHKIDLDMIVGEPVQRVYPEDDSVAWYSSADGPTTPGGKFSEDSFYSMTPQETWTAKPQLSEGRYFLSALNPYFSISKETITARLECTIDGVTRSIDTSPIIMGQRFDGFAVDITKTGVAVDSLAPGMLSERELKQLEKFRLFGDKSLVYH